MAESAPLLGDIDGLSDGELPPASSASPAPKGGPAAGQSAPAPPTLVAPPLHDAQKPSDDDADDAEYLALRLMDAGDARADGKRTVGLYRAVRGFSWALLVGGLLASAVLVADAVVFEVRHREYGFLPHVSESTAYAVVWCVVSSVLALATILRLRRLRRVLLASTSLGSPPPSPPYTTAVLFPLSLPLLGLALHAFLAYRLALFASHTLVSLIMAGPPCARYATPDPLLALLRQGGVAPPSAAAPAGAASKTDCLLAPLFDDAAPVLAAAMRACRVWTGVFRALVGTGATLAALVGVAHGALGGAAAGEAFRQGRRWWKAQTLGGAAEEGGGRARAAAVDVPVGRGWSVELSFKLKRTTTGTADGGGDVGAGAAGVGADARTGDQLRVQTQPLIE